MKSQNVFPRKQVCREGPLLANKKALSLMDRKRHKIQPARELLKQGHPNVTNPVMLFTVSRDGSVLRLTKED